MSRRDILHDVSNEKLCFTVKELPRASTCTNTLYLPGYPSAEILEEKLTLAVDIGHEGFMLV